MSFPYGELVATTLEFYEKSISDNIYQDHVALNHMKANGGTKKYTGGTKIRVPLMYETNSTVKAFTGQDSLDLTYQDTVDTAEYDYKFYNVSITFTLTDELKNSGKEAVLDILEAKIKQAEMSLAERLNNDLYNGAASDSKEITGFETIVKASGSLGGINGSTYSWWVSTVDSDSETLTVADMRAAKNSANLGAGGKKVSIGLTTQTLYQKYFSLLTASYQMNPVKGKETTRLGDGGFTAVELDGIPVTFDEDCTSGSLYWLNMSNLKLGIHQDANFKVIKKAEPTDQHLSVSHIVFAGNTVVNRRASLASLTGKTA